MNFLDKKKSYILKIIPKVHVFSLIKVNKSNLSVIFLKLLFLNAKDFTSPYDKVRRGIKIGTIID